MLLWLTDISTCQLCTWRTVIAILNKYAKSCWELKKYKQHFNKSILAVSCKHSRLIFRQLGHNLIGQVVENWQSTVWPFLIDTFARCNVVSDWRSSFNKIFHKLQLATTNIYRKTIILTYFCYLSFEAFSILWQIFFIGFIEFFKQLSHLTDGWEIHRYIDDRQGGNISNRDHKDHL